MTTGNSFVSKNLLHNTDFRLYCTEMEIGASMPPRSSVLRSPGRDTSKRVPSPAKLSRTTSGLTEVSQGGSIDDDERTSGSTGESDEIDEKEMAELREQIRQEEAEDAALAASGQDLQGLDDLLAAVPSVTGVSSSASAAAAAARGSSSPHMRNGTGGVASTPPPNSDNGTPRTSSRGKWNSEEDELLKEAVEVSFAMLFYPYLSNIHIVCF